jgi:hypothetical protein
MPTLNLVQVPSIALTLSSAVGRKMDQNDVMVVVRVQAPAPEPPESKTVGRRPLGLEWRSSYWLTTLVVGSGEFFDSRAFGWRLLITEVFLGIAIDLLVFSIIIPVIPFQLEQLGYEGVSGLAGWLLFAYVSSGPSSDPRACSN